jgi:hypothetical protein
MKPLKKSSKPIAQRIAEAFEAGTPIDRAVYRATAAAGAAAKAAAAARAAARARKATPKR